MSKNAEEINKEYNELLDAALANPGVAEAMKLFSRHQPTLNAHARLVTATAIPAQLAISTGTMMNRNN
ncbi:MULTISPECIES: hypothetical protein [Phytobacter]|uniref:hypothetical protein n=1 Tax=Phytobacter TaxID=447792 RepID=UPI000DF5D8B5|nr:MULTISPECIES: hypothetical protein [Phytobacter]BBE76890.1 hypothetical protein MRY16398_19460 [Phytobacter sp. MRY16-398]